MINDIKATAHSLDTMTMPGLGSLFRSLTTSAGGLLTMVESITAALGTMNYTMQSIKVANHGGQIADGFVPLRTIIREIRAAAGGLNTELKEAAGLAGRMGTAAQRVSRARAPAAGGGAVAADAGAAPMSTALVVRQDSQYLAMAQERARMMAQVSAAEEVERQKQLAAQAEVFAQTRAFYQARAAAAEMAAGADIAAAHASMQARIAAEREAQAAFEQTQAIRKQQLAEVADADAMAREEEIQNAGAMYMRLRAFQNEHVQNVENAARQEMESIERVMHARLRAAEQFRVVSRQQAGQQLALGPGRTDREAAEMFASRAFEPLTRRQRMQIPEEAGPSAYTERFFAGGGAAEGARRAWGGFEEVNKTLDKTSGALKNTKEHKDRLDKNLKDTASNTLPKFNSAWLVTIGYFALFQTRRIIDELSQLGKSLFQTGVEFEKAFALMKAGAGDSAEEGARRMQVMSDLARRLGLDLPQLAIDYGKVMAAAKGSDIEGRQAEDMVRNLASAMAVLGQNTEKGSGLIKVFTDVLSKGRLQSEELVKQLGNAVPGAFRVVAQSLNMTTTQLQDAVAKGSISATQTLVKLAAEINKIYGAQALENLNRLSGAFNGLKQSLTEVALLIVNMNTGIMSGGGGTFGKALVDAFKQLSDLLQDREIQTRIVELANFITNILAAAFHGLIVVLQFVAEHMQAFIGIVTALTSAAIVAGVVALSLAFKGLFLAFIGFAATGPGAVIMITGLLASLILGAKAAEMFGEATKGVSEALQKMRDDQEKLRQQQAPGNTNPADQTRAVQQALNRVEAEQRRFVEGVRQEAQMLELSASGVSTLSARYEAYLNVLERIKAQEVKELFQILSPQDAATMKRRLTEALLVAETVKQAIGDIVGMFKSLDQAQEEFATKVATATATLRTIREGGFTDAGQQMQEQYDQKVLPVMRRVRDELRHIADPALARTLVSGFNEWSASMRDNIRDLRVMSDLMGAVTDITRGLRDFRFAQQKTDLLSTIDAGTEFVKQTIQAESDDLRVLLSDGFPELKPPKIRTLGEELKEGFNPVKAGEEMGKSFTDVFTKGMETSVQKIIDEMKKMAEAIKTPAITGTGGPYLKEAGKYEELFKRAGDKYGVDPELLARFARFESEFKADAVAKDKAGNPIPGGGQGIMQFIPSTQKLYGLSGQDVFDPEKAVMAGARYVADLLKQTGGDLMEVVRGYRGKRFEEDPEYYNRVLGGYGGKGAITPSAQVAAPKPPAGSTEPQMPPAFGLGPLEKRETFWQFLTGKLSQLDTTLGITSPFKPGQGMRFEAGDVGELKPTETPPERVVPTIPGIKTEERAKQTAEETQKIKEQEEATRKLKEAEQARLAVAEAMAKERKEKEAEYAKFQEDLDKTVAGLEKQIGSLTKLGDLEASADTHRQARIAGIQEARQAQEKYNAITEDMMKQLMLIGQGKFYLQAIQQGNDFIRNLNRQTAAVREETAALEESPLTREATAQTRARRREAAAAGLAYPQAAAREKAITDAQDAAVEDSVKKFIVNSEKEQRMLQMEMESLNDNTIARAANLEMRKQNDELLRNSAGLSEDQKRRIRESNEGLKQTRLALDQAKGPLRQYIDGLADFSSQATISNAIQQSTAELFKGVEDSIISFAKTGKLSFSELADSFIESIQRMVIQALILRPIMEALNQALSGGTGDGAGAGAGAGGMSGAGKAFNIFSTIFKFATAAAGAAGGMGGGTTPTVAGSTGRTIDVPQVAAVASRGATGGWVTASGIQLFQGGGMAGFGSDTVPAMLTPGEMVLNKEQQANVFGKKDAPQNNTFNMVFPNVSNEDQARKTAAQAYSEISSRLERQRVRDGIRTRR